MFSERRTSPAEAGRRRLRAEQTARQQRLHVAPAIGNQIDGHLLTDHSIDEPVGFEVGLAVLPDTEGQKFRWMRPALWKLAKTLRGFQQLVEDVVRALRGVELLDVVVDLFEIAFAPSVRNTSKRIRQQTSSRGAGLQPSRQA